MFSQAFRSTTHRLVLAVVVLGLGVFFGARLTGLAWAAPQAVTLAHSAEAQPMAQVPANIAGVSPNAPLEPIYAICTVTQAGVNYMLNTAGFQSTDCSPSTGAIQYFVVPADSKMANQVLSIALTARATGHQISMYYDSAETSGLPSTIRKILSLGMN